MRVVVFYCLLMLAFCGGLPGSESAAAAMLVSEPAIRVHVGGAVKRPGVYRLPIGSRVAEAIASAGGVARRADLSDLNLAAVLQDGEQFVVPLPAPPGGRVAPALPRHRLSSRVQVLRQRQARVVLNRASVQELQTLPGVGPAMAKRILEVRARLGRFETLDDLREVPGIGVKRLSKLRARLVLD
ncbi:MAG: helix-hairpin-helix domain-containing protein [Candidatus Sericytochromatia bacterium]|nr:helix-hairpin-helix domain-containing protein [Candidatus Sericytochromatia bacterium]